MKVMAVLILLTATQAWATPAIVGTWKTTAQKCEKNGVLINGYADSTTVNSITRINADGTLSAKATFQAAEVSVSGNYQISGTTLTTVLTEAKTPEGTQPMNQTMVSTFAVTTDQLTITSLPMVSSDQSCPLGDKQVTVFERVK